MSSLGFVVGPLPRRLVGLVVLALAVALLPGGAVWADAPRSDFPGQVGSIVERSGDGLVPSFRYRGEQRFDTAHLIAEDTFVETVTARETQTALVARGNLFPDSLSGNYLAGQLRAPILLTPTESLVDDTSHTLEDLGADEVVVLGSTEAVSQGVEDQLAAAGYEVSRFGGIDRYETAADIATRPGNVVGGLSETLTATAIVASGDNFPDALVTGAISFDQDFPLLLTYQDHLPDVTIAALESLNIDSVVIPGGVVPVAQSVEAELEAMGIEVLRLAGPTRVDTALEVAGFALDEFDWTFTEPMFARGDEFADALTVGPRQGLLQQVLLLTNTPGNVGQNNLDFLEELGCFVNRIGFAGGYVAITQAAEDQIRAAATSDQACNLELTPESATNVIGEAHTMTATVTTNAGAPVETGTVRFEVYDQFPVSETQTARFLFLVETVTVGADGTATFSYDGLFPGQQFIVACVVPEGEPCTTGDPFAGENVEPRRDVPAIDTAIKNWETEFGGELFGTAEVDSNGIPGDEGDPDGFGVTAVSVTDDGRLCYGIGVLGIQLPALAAHIHAAPIFESGTVVVPLEAPVPVDLEGLPPGVEFGQAAGCIEGVDEGLLAAIEANPSEFYVNVHTEEFPDGAVRGQLFPGEFGLDHIHERFADLTGAEVVAPTIGDPDGSGLGAVGGVDASGGDYLHFHFVVENIPLPADSAHIHQGAAGTEGPIVVNLLPPQEFLFAPPGAGSSAGWVDLHALEQPGDTTARFADILANPGDYYMEVHSADGAIRGQLDAEPPPEFFGAARDQTLRFGWGAR
ncbi:MAG TPA: cell wall-binding repeat-containing protein [Egibacteraceae bacterium]|nr:cell wall-binding repeat-containing protein [Egibacteraceae bacterium]